MQLQQVACDIVVSQLAKQSILERVEFEQGGGGGIYPGSVCQHSNSPFESARAEISPVSTHAWQKDKHTRQQTDAEQQLAMHASTMLH